VGGQIKNLIQDTESLGPEIADDKMRHFDIDQADIVVTQKEFVGKTLEELRASLPAYGCRVRALFRDGHELPLLPGTELRRHDVVRVAGPPESVRRLSQALGIPVRPTNATDIITLGLCIAAGYAVGLITIRIGGIPIGLGTMGGIVIAG